MRRLAFVIDEGLRRDAVDELHGGPILDVRFRAVYSRTRLSARGRSITVGNCRQTRVPDRTIA
jgi:hypothetical protein